MSIQTLEEYLDSQGYWEDVPNEYVIQVCDDDGYTISPCRGMKENT